MILITENGDDHSRFYGFKWTIFRFLWKGILCLFAWVHISSITIDFLFVFICRYEKCCLCLL